MMKFALLWFIREQVVVISRPPNKGQVGCPETSVRNYHYSLRNNPEERSSQLYLLFTQPNSVFLVALGTNSDYFPKGH